MRTVHCPHTPESSLESDRQKALSLLRSLGAVTIDVDWEAGVDALLQNTRSGSLEDAVQDLLWDTVLSRAASNDPDAFRFFASSVHRLLAKHDHHRRHEASWDDVVQSAAIQILQARERGPLERPWMFVCTVVRRRYIDLHRRTKDTTEVREDHVVSCEGGAGALTGLLPSRARAELSPREWDVIERMDFREQTRAEVANAWGVAEGNVVAARRSALRKLYHLLGSTLPTDLRRIWDEMFRGNKRFSPSQVAPRLGLSAAHVSRQLSGAHDILGLPWHRADDAALLQAS